AEREISSAQRGRRRTRVRWKRVIAPSTGVVFAFRSPRTASGPHSAPASRELGEDSRPSHGPQLGYSHDCQSLDPTYPGPLHYFVCAKRGLRYTRLVRHSL